MSSASALSLERPGDASQFDKAAGDFLRAREAENNLALGIISGLVRPDARRYTAAPYFSVVRDGGRVAGAALRLGLWLILADGTDRAALPLLIDDAIAAQPDTPGIVGPKDLARDAAAQWTARTGVAARLNVAERIYRLERVVAPRSATGSARLATDADRELIASWLYSFATEALPNESHTREAAQRNADGWIGGHAMWLWVDGEPVSMTGASGRTPNGIRISAVYTPPPKRRHGYASALVAAVSQAQLDSGLRYCFLYTDLANPTSNKIYQDIGYEPVCDVDQYSFVIG